MRAPAEYCPATVADIRTRAGHGMRLLALARYLGWDSGRLKRIAERHGIYIVEESPDELARAASSAVVELKPKPAPSPVSKSRSVKTPATTSTQDPAQRFPVAPKRVVTRGPRGAGTRYPVNISAIVTREMGADIHNFAAREAISQLEAVRRLIAAGFVKLGFLTDQVLK